MLNDARPVRIVAMSCCRSESAFSILVLMLASTSFTEVNTGPLGVACCSVFIAKCLRKALRLVNHSTDGFTHRHTNYTTKLHSKPFGIFTGDYSVSEFRVPSQVQERTVTVLKKQSGGELKELAQFPGLCRTDGTLPVERLVDVAALAEDWQQQLGGGFAGMLDQELQAFGGCRVIRRHAMLAVVVLDEDGEQVHEAVFGSCPAALHEKVAETRAEAIIILIVLDAAG